MKRRFSEHMVTMLVCSLLMLQFAVFVIVLWKSVPNTRIRLPLLGLSFSILFTFSLWFLFLRYRVSAFSNQLCSVLDALIAGRTPKNYHPYDDSLTSKVEGKLLQYFDIMKAGREESLHDKEIIQEMVSDISHQVKTPIANAKMFTNILQQRELTAVKHSQFLDLLDAQINSLDFLMQSLIKMSRLETGTFALHMEQIPIYNTIAQAVNGIWAKAEEKDIVLSVECDSSIYVKHDMKWTAEALMNLLDNAVKYTPAGGSVAVCVKSWQFYTRIDITDSGIGIKEEDYHKIFQRFYRAPEAADKEGVGLGLYLARGIITRQRGYISLKSKPMEKTTFSVNLLSQN